LNEAPYQASLIKTGQYWCGASIIHQDFVVTAAHCVISRISSDFQVRVGTVFKEIDGEVIGVSKIIFHPYYDRRTNVMDIALIKLRRSITLISGQREIIKMVNQNEELGEGTLTLVSGWGETRNANELNTMLRGVIVPIVGLEKCRNSYPDLSYDVICAGYFETGGRDACSGKQKLFNSHSDCDCYFHELFFLTIFR
jgi:trypsin